MNISELSMSFGEKILFNNINLKLKKKEKYGLIGANGAGKTTFLNILTKKTPPTTGEVITNISDVIGYLEQDQHLYLNEKIVNVVIAGNKKLFNLFKEQNEIYNKIENKKYGSDTELYDITQRISEIEMEIDTLDGYSAHANANKILKGLGIYNTDNTLSSLSGGYRLRVLLARTLFQNPDILLLDEPTNHLDVKSIIWLEKYLKKEFNGILVFISHDTGFLNGLSTYILDVDYNDIRMYFGNYNKFLIRKEEEKILLQKKANNAQKKIDQMQNFIDKFGAKATKAKQAKSMEKRIDKIDKPEVTQTSRVYPKIHFPNPKHSPQKALIVNNISKSFKDKQLLNKLSFNVTRGDKVIILGENGIGKSTLLKILINEIKQDKGSIEWHEKINYGYFAQNHHESLDSSSNVLEWILPSCKGSIELAMKTLNQMLITDSKKNIGTLSGGESAKLLIGRLTICNYNFLILDEPTNHLDVESILALQTALQKFEGTVVLVTHDRSFANAIANRIIYIKQDKVINYAGKYEDFIFKYHDEIIGIN